MRPTLQSVDRRIDRIEVRLDDHTVRLESLEQKVDDNFQILNKKIDDNFQTLDKKIDDNFQILDKKIDDNFHTLVRHIDLRTESVLSEIRCFRDELKGQSRRVDRLEAVADSHAYRLEHLERRRRRKAAPRQG